MGLVGSWYSTWFSTFCQRGFPFHCFPLAGSAPSPFLLLTLRGCGTLSGSSLRVYSCGGALWLGWRGICCVTWFSPMCRALPQGPAACAAFPAAGYLGVFRSLGVCPSVSLVTLVGHQPFPSFSVLLLRLLAGVGWVMHPVSGCSSCGGVCLG